MRGRSVVGPRSAQPVLLLASDAHLRDELGPLARDEHAEDHFRRHGARRRARELLDDVGSLAFVPPYGVAGYSRNAAAALAPGCCTPHCRAGVADPPPKESPVALENTVYQIVAH